MDGKALEVALALSRLPSMRAALRQRPLPDDVRLVIELAPGAPHRLAAAAAGSNVTSEQLLEAVRFYIREVLMFEGADAYRVLGVAPDASPPQLKANHRALQHWLHPDRRADAWESIYATRINSAWAELRTPGRRAAYDARNATVSFDDATAPHRVLVSDWRAVRGQQTQSQWFGWVGLVLAMALCLCLVLLANRQARMPAPEWRTESAQPIDSGDRTSFASLLERVNANPPADGTLPSAAAVGPAAAMLPPATATPLVVIRSEPDDPFPSPQADATTRIQQAPLLAPASDELVARVAGHDQAPVAPPPAMPERPTAMPVAQSQPSAVSSMARVQASAAAADIAPTVERVRLAHRRGDEITRYLTGPADRAPPIWRSAAAFDAAASLREQFDGGRSRIARFRYPTRFGDPVWRIAADRASMLSTIHRGRDESAHGTLHVELAWRDGMWLVDSLEATNLEAEIRP